MNKPGRNDPCPCGSGLKYKKCCLSRQASTPAHQDDLTSQLALAYKKMSEENWSQAIDLFKKNLETAADNHVVLEALASCYDALDDYLTAAEYYEKALAVCPESKKFETYYRLGVSRACAERHEKAEEAFRYCLELHEHTEQKEFILSILRRLGEIRSGKEDSHHFRVRVQLQRAFSDMEADRYEAAAAKLKPLAAMEPENPAIFYNLGVVYTFLNREDEAIANFQQAVHLHPDYAQAWYNMGQIFLIKKRHFSRALNCFDRALAIRPDYIGAHHQRGIAYELVGDPHKAVECWQKTLQLDPDNKQAQDNIARLLGSTPNPSSGVGD